MPAGSVRIDSTATDAMPSVAFKTPAGKTALVVSNPSANSQNFAVRERGKSFTTSLDAGSVGTYVW